MKRTAISSLFAASAFAMISGYSFAATTVNGGRVDFEGDVVSAACALDLSSAKQTVKMGQVRTSAFTGVGVSTSSVAFDITLTGCNVSAESATRAGQTRADSSNVAIGFTGVVDSTNDKALSLNGGDGAADGIGLQIKDAGGKVVPLDGKASTSVLLNDDRVVVPFQAYYISTKPSVKAGKANATATFTITYS